MHRYGELSMVPANSKLATNALFDDFGNGELTFACFGSKPCDVGKVDGT
jgi:hypothetical protein